VLLRLGLAPAEELSVLAHELAHELLHHGADRATTPRRVRELEAEAVAFVVSEAIGLDTSTACADYIQLYQGSTESLAQSLAAIQQTAATILEALLPEDTQALAA
jgi:hypothetical protein